MLKASRRPAEQLLGADQVVECAHGFDESLGAADLELMRDDLRTIDNALSTIVVQGDRY